MNCRYDTLRCGLRRRRLVATLDDTRTNDSAQLRTLLLNAFHHHHYNNYPSSPCAHNDMHNTTLGLDLHILFAYSCVQYRAPPFTSPHLYSCYTTVYHIL